MTSNKEFEVPFYHKYGLTIKEASAYFGIGENKLRELVSGDAPVLLGCTIKIGRKTLIKRPMLEEVLNGVNEL